MISMRSAVLVSLVSTVAGAALMFAYTSVMQYPEGKPLAASAAAAVVSATSTLSPSSATTTIFDSMRTSTSSADQSQAPSSVNTPHQYRLLFSVDLCTLNTLGKDGWQPVQYGQIADANGNTDYLQAGPGRDETCQASTAHLTRTFVWILFEREIPQ